MVDIDENALRHALNAKVGESPRAVWKDLVQRWMLFVEKVQRGYPQELGLYDYSNDLSVRDIIERVLDSVSTTGRQELLSEVDRADELFRRSTIRIESPVVPYAEKEQWWRWRLPPVRGADFEADLKDLIG